MPAASWLLAKAIENRSLMPITSPVDRISGPSTMSTPANLANGKTLSLTETWLGIGSRVDALLGERHAGHHLGRDVGHRHAGGLGDERHRAAGARIDFQHVQHLPAVFALDGELNVHQSDDAHVPGQRVRGLADFVQDRPGQAVRRNRAGRVAGVDAGLFDVLHDAGDDHLLAVADGIDIDFDGVFQKAVDQHRLALATTMKASATNRSNCDWS